MITSGPFAWSSRLRFDRQRNRVVVLSCGASVPQVLTAFASGRRAFDDFKAAHGGFTTDDLDSCLAYGRFVNTYQGKDPVAALELEDPTAGGAAPAHPFLARMAVEVGNKGYGRKRVATVHDAVRNLLAELSDLAGSTGAMVGNPDVILELLARMAAECQHSAVDLGLVKSTKDDDECPF